MPADLFVKKHAIWSVISKTYFTKFVSWNHDIPTTNNFKSLCLLSFLKISNLVFKMFFSIFKYFFSIFKEFKIVFEISSQFSNISSRFSNISTQFSSKSLLSILKHLINFKNVIVNKSRRFMYYIYQYVLNYLFETFKSVLGCCFLIAIPQTLILVKPCHRLTMILLVSCCRTLY